MSNVNRYYLSRQQKNLFLLESKGSSPITQGVFRISGVLTSDEINSMMTHCIAEHNALRTFYVKDQAMIYPLQEIMGIENTAGFLVMKQGGLKDLDALMKEVPNINSNNPLQIDVVHSEIETWIVFTISSCNADAAAMAVLGESMRRWMAFGADSSKSDNVTYLEFSQWQEELAEDLAQEETFWQTYSVEMPRQYSFYTPSLLPDQTKTQVSFMLDETLLLAWRKICNGVTHEIYLFAWAFVLSKHNMDLPVSIGYVPRARQFDELKSLVGAVSTTLPLTIHFAVERTLSDNMRIVQNKLQQVENNLYHFILVREQIKYDVSALSVGYQYLDAKSDTHHGITLEKVYCNHHPQTIQLSVIENNESIRFQLVYDQSYTDQAVKILFEQFIRVVEMIVTQPQSILGELDLADERTPNKGKGSTGKSLFNTVSSAIQSVAASSPEKTAVFFNSAQLTYGALNTQSDKIARILIKTYGISVHDRIGIYMERSDSMILTLLGIIKSGATYVPLDPKDAPARIEFMLGDSQCKLLITDTTFAGITVMPVVEFSEILNQKDELIELPVLIGSDAVYMIYTSGTSGRPKGVPIRHESLLNYVYWIQESFGVSSEDVTALISSHAFDLGYTSLWAGLLSGATLHITPEYLIQTPEVFVQYLLSHRVSYLKSTPSLFSLLFSEGKTSMKQLISQMRLLILGGEKIKVDDVAAVWQLNPDLRIVNHYGPTETTIGIAAHKLEASRLNYYRHHCVIGTTCRNNCIYVLDAALRPCATGIRGEIYVSGISVSHGYNTPEKQNNRFLLHPAWNIMLYKTGDEGCWNAYGELEFFGRVDQQVKINGYRVELSEIEHALSEISSIKDVAVCLQKNATGNALVGYYVSEIVYNQMYFRSFLENRIPAHMIPSVFQRIPQIPLTINGKIDYAALPGLNAFIEGPGEELRDASALENSILKVWRNVLGDDNIDINTNFFSCGGDSIKAIQIASRLHTQGYAVSVRDIFSHPQVSKLALVVKPSRTFSNNLPVSGPIAMTPVFHYFFETIKHAPQHYNQSLWLNVGAVDELTMAPILHKIVEHHDILRLTVRYAKDQNTVAFIQPVGFNVPLDCIEVSGTLDEKKFMEKSADEFQRRFNIETGPLIRACLYKRSHGNILLLILHHLVTDAVSWNIIVEDMKSLFEMQNAGKLLQLPERTCSYDMWAERLIQYASDEQVRSQLAYWQNIPQTDSLSQTIDGANCIKDVESVEFTLTKAMTEKIRKYHQSHEQTRIPALIIASLSMAMHEVFGMKEVLIMMESHGREEIDDAIQLHRTVGWFTALYPFLAVVTDHDYQTHLPRVTQSMMQIPQHGLGYGILRYLTEKGKTILQHRPSVRLNYLGSYIGGTQSDDITTDLSYGVTEDSDEPRAFLIDIVACVKDGQFDLRLSYSRQQFPPDQMNLLLKLIQDHLIQSADAIHGEGVVPDGVAFNHISQEELNNFF